MTCEIRRLTGADVALWRDLRLEALRIFPANFLTTLAEEEKRSDADRVRMLEARQVFGLFLEGAAAGTAALDPEPAPATAHRVTLNAFYVRPAFHGGPGARALLAHVIQVASAQGFVQLELCVAADNTRAIRFYEREGFTVWGRLPRSVRLVDSYQDDLFMLRPLDAAAMA
ncbi:GNAT family N-acetyltransferase [Sulfitobacter albidus]|uniref:GNAT family N-acetyltransferase n=1 Tax=Sulfitobacter albidus TaxID=2829501 RepID=A0A975PMC5_9RHOB|nr:GNAT family N-acetyltransferase [Sulfitobacter albidus]QUJ76667.1 GNAT family N-acetyltransferase [Sulfitobacter albidus]